MKNKQQGFIVPVLIIIIAILLVGGGFYIFSKNRSLKIVEGQLDSQLVATSTIPSQDNKQDSAEEVRIYSDIKYNFKFSYPNNVRLLTDVKGDGADPMIISVQNDASIYSIVVTDDEKQYPIPRMMQMSEQNIKINNISVTKTSYYTDQTKSKISYVGYDFISSGQSFLFAAYLKNDSSDRITEDLIEKIISTFKKN